MKRKTVFLILIIFSMLLRGFCDENKIAVIDMEKIFQGYYKTKIADANLKKQADIFKDYVEKLNESNLKLQEEFKELRDASQNIALSEVERENKRLAAAEKFTQLKAKEAELAQYNREKQQQLRNQYEELRNSLLKEIKETIKRQCEEKGYIIVLDISGKTLNNIPSVMYFSPVLELTDSVLEEINRGAAKKTEKPKKVDME